MKIIIMSCLCLLMAYTVSAQKHDAVWLVGVDSIVPLMENGKITFTDTAVLLDSVRRKMGIICTNNAISDTAGNLLFYTNGIDINNSQYNYVGSINAGDMADDYALPQPLPSFCAQHIGHNVRQGAIILPQPLHSDSLYYIFYQHLDVYPTNGEHITLMYSIYDIYGNSGNGIIRSKDIILTPDNILLGQLSAVKHANGRDWWLMQPMMDSVGSGFYALLVQNDSIVLKHKQYIGQRIDRARASYGQAVFSPNGNIYARYDHWNGLEIFNFNRCNGYLSNRHYYHINSDSGIYYGGGGGVCISANSRFLYVGAHDKLYQYDLQAVDRGTSRETVATNNRCVGQYFQYAPYSYYGIMELAPNGKIYGSIGINDVMHVIDSPNYKGAACQVSPCGFYTYYVNNPFSYNFPHYRTPAIPESDCWLPPNPEPNEGGDIISGTDKTTEKDAIKLYPNPARTVIYLQSDLAMADNTKIFIYNHLGQLLKTLSTNANTLIEINVADLPNGIYSLHLDSKPKPIIKSFTIDR